MFLQFTAPIVIKAMDHYDYKQKDTGDRKVGTLLTMENPKGRSSKDMLIDFMVDKNLAEALQLHIEEVRLKWVGKRVNVVFGLSFFGRSPSLTVVKLEEVK